MSRFSSKGSPTWTLGRLSSSAPSLGAEAGRGQHAHAADAVAPGGGAEEHGQVALAVGPGQHQVLLAEHPQAEHVDQRVAGVAGREGELAADGGDADGVAVAGDARHHPFHQPAAAGVVGGAEEERVHEGDGPGPHGEDVAQDAAHAGGRPLVGLDGRRVVVALDAQGHGDAVTDVDDAGVLARAHQDLRVPRWAGGADADATTCRSSARSTSRRTWPAPGGWGGGRGSRRCAPPRRR